MRVQFLVKYNCGVFSPFAWYYTNACEVTSHLSKAEYKSSVWFKAASSGVSLSHSLTPMLWFVCLLPAGPDLSTCDSPEPVRAVLYVVRLGDVPSCVCLYIACVCCSIEPSVANRRRFWQLWLQVKYFQLYLGTKVENIHGQVKCRATNVWETTCSPRRTVHDCIQTLASATKALWSLLVRFHLHLARAWYQLSIRPINTRNIACCYSSGRAGASY